MTFAKPASRLLNCKLPPVATPSERSFKTACHICDVWSSHSLNTHDVDEADDIDAVPWR